MTKRKCEIVVSIETMLKIRVKTMMPATLLAYQHEDLSFQTTTSKAEIMLPLWNNFLQSSLRFVMVRPGHDERLGRIIFRSVPHSLVAERR